ncbi:MAG: hypothetical protein JXL80_05020 [Planctomycetes bacterium]|nr:hypothetical protein [Planctomycetota bacterium]
MNRLLMLMVVAVVCGGLAGCGYSTDALHRTDIRTVAVPIFQSDEFRRGLEMELTEELKKMIELRTPYKIVNEEHADTIISGRIIDLRENVMTEDDRDRATEIQTSLYVHYEWKDLRSGQVLHTGSPKVAWYYAPRERQTLRSATTMTIRKMAETIIEDMESDW